MLKYFRIKDHFFQKTELSYFGYLSDHSHQEVEVHHVTNQLSDILSICYCTQKCEVYHLLNGTKVASISWIN
jgi:hypothetical protein